MAGYRGSGHAADARENEPDTDQPMCADLLLTSVGTATPKAAAVIVEALGLPREFVVDAIYRAPARLLGNLPTADTQRLVEMLGQLGLQAEAALVGTVPVRGTLFDIAIRIDDPLRISEVAQALGQFLGMPAQAALDLILTPPGIVLGNVTQATVDALTAAVPSGAATTIVSDPATARYALFATDVPPAHRAAIQTLLPRGQEADVAGEALSCFDLAKSEADALWRRLCTLETIRVVNQDFLHFTLVLMGVPDDPHAGSQALMNLAGVPNSLYGELVDALPCPIVEGVPYADLQTSLQRYTEAGFIIHADLETFVMTALDIRSGPPDALAAAGLSGKIPLVTVPMPREQARVLRARLEALGAEVLPA